jgi:hypothetical protein
VLTGELSWLALYNWFLNDTIYIFCYLIYVTEFPAVLIGLVRGQLKQSQNTRLQ